MKTFKQYYNQRLVENNVCADLAYRLTILHDMLEDNDFSRVLELPANVAELARQVMSDLRQAKKEDRDTEEIEKYGFTKFRELADLLSKYGHILVQLSAGKKINLNKVSDAVLHFAPPSGKIAYDELEPQHNMGIFPSYRDPYHGNKMYNID